MGNTLKILASVSRLHIVVIAVVATFTFGWLFTGVYPWFLAAVVGLDWFLVNILNRVVDLDEDKANAITGTDFVERHAGAIKRGGFALLIASFAVVAWVAPVILPLRLAYHALGFAYNWPLLPGQRRRIKALYFWKNTASAVGFMITLFGYPLAAAWAAGVPLAPGITWLTVAWTAAFFFLFELSYEVIYDLRDAPGDAAEGVRTYPVVHGERGAVWIIDALIGLSMAILVVGYALSIVPWAIFVMIAAPVLQLVLYKRALRRGITSGDCIAITWLGAALLVAYHAWFLLELPGAHGL